MRNFHEILTKDGANDNIKSHKKSGIFPLCTWYIFWKTKGAGQIDSPQPPRISHRLSKCEKSKSLRLSLLNIILRQLSTSALRNLIKGTSFIWVMAFFNKADLDFVRSSYNFTPFFTLFPEYGERNTFEVLFDGLSK